MAITSSFFIMFTFSFIVHKSPILQRQRNQANPLVNGDKIAKAAENLGIKTSLSKTLMQT
jgi:hypothetical protein